MKKFKNAKGITLLELITVVVIIGIVAAMAFPQFDKAMKRIRFRSGAKSIVSKLRLARSNAISQKVQCGVCLNSSNGLMLTFLDTVNTASFRYDFGDPILSIDSLPMGFTLDSTCNIVYRPNGSASVTHTINFAADYDSTLDLKGSINVLASTGRTKITRMP